MANTVKNGPYENVGTKTVPEEMFGLRNKHAVQHQEHVKQQLRISRGRHRNKHVDRRDKAGAGATRGGYTRQ